MVLTRHNSSNGLLSCVGTPVLLIREGGVCWGGAGFETAEFEEPAESDGADLFAAVSFGASRCLRERGTDTDDSEAVAAWGQTRTAAMTDAAPNRLMPAAIAPRRFHAGEAGAEGVFPGNVSVGCVPEAAVFKMGRVGCAAVGGGSSACRAVRRAASSSVGTETGGMNCVTSWTLPTPRSSCAASRRSAARASVTPSGCDCSSVVRTSDALRAALRVFCHQARNQVVERVQGGFIGLVYRSRQAIQQPGRWFG